MTNRLFRYVPHHRTLDYARLGWTIADTLEGTPHGQWAILMTWLCECPCVQPAPHHARSRHQHESPANITAAAPNHLATPHQRITR